MRNFRLVLGLAALVALGCDSREPARAAGADESLARDLALAEAAQPLTLPGTVGPRSRFVSAVELAPPGRQVAVSPKPRPRATQRAPKRARAVAPRPKPAPAPVTIAAATQDEAPEPAAEAVEETVADAGPAAEPVIENPRPHPAPPVDRGPSDGGSGGGGSGDDGGWGGVVIRGGGVDGDHCERHRRGGRIGMGGIGVAIGGGRVGGPLISINVRGPVGTTTFPRY